MLRINNISSGRPEFTPKDRISTEMYLLEGIEKWREINKIDKFVLCGHSLGGYIAAKYAAYNPDKLLALILLSPAGVWGKPPNIPSSYKPWKETKGLFLGAIYNLIVSRWTPGKSPFQLFRATGRFSYFFLKKYTSYFQNLKPEVSNLYLI